eukprot:scaffold69_cov198-Alexandrium_tamarense.AAC.26
MKDDGSTQLARYTIAEELPRRLYLFGGSYFLASYYTISYSRTHTKVMECRQSNADIMLLSSMAI